MTVVMRIAPTVKCAIDLGEGKKKRDPINSKAKKYSTTTISLKQGQAMSNRRVLYRYRIMKEMRE